MTSYQDVLTLIDQTNLDYLGSNSQKAGFVRVYKSIATNSVYYLLKEKQSVTYGYSSKVTFNFTEKEWKEKYKCQKNYWFELINNELKIGNRD